MDPETAATEIHRDSGVESFTIGDRPASAAVPGFELDLAALLAT